MKTGCGSFCQAPYIDRYVPLRYSAITITFWGIIMKRNVLLLFLGLMMICLFSCGTTTNVFDDTVPLERSAVLTIAPQFILRSYNGITVKLKTALFGNTGFTVPAGRTALVFDLDTGRTFGNTRYYAKNISLTYNFAAGNEYNIWLGFVDKEGNYKATNLGETYLALILYQGKNPRDALHVIKLQ